MEGGRVSGNKSRAPRLVFKPRVGVQIVVPVLSKPAKRSSRRRFGLILALLSIVLMPLTAGCFFGRADRDVCEPAAIEFETKDQEKKARSAIEEADSLPSGFCLYKVSINRNDRSGVLGVNVYLSVVDSKGKRDDLRPAATEIAHVIKKLQFADPVTELYVSNLTPKNGVHDHAGVVDRNFQDHPWDGTPSNAAELGLWVAWTPIQ